MRKYDKYRPVNPLCQSAWHKARLDLQGFMVQNKKYLPRGLVQIGRDIWRDGSQKYPSHSLQRGWYVELIYGFIEDCENEIKKPKTLKRAA